MHWLIGIGLSLLALALAGRYVFTTAVRPDREDTKRADNERATAYRRIYGLDR